MTELHICVTINDTTLPVASLAAALEPGSPIEQRHWILTKKCIGLLSLTTPLNKITHRISCEKPKKCFNFSPSPQISVINSASTVFILLKEKTNKKYNDHTY